MWRNRDGRDRQDTEESGQRRWGVKAAPSHAVFVAGLSGGRPAMRHASLSVAGPAARGAVEPDGGEGRTAAAGPYTRCETRGDTRGGGMAIAERVLHGRSPNRQRAVRPAHGCVDDAIEQRIGSADDETAAAPQPPGCARHGRADPPE